MLLHYWQEGLLDMKATIPKEKLKWSQTEQAHNDGELLVVISCQDNFLYLQSYKQVSIGDRKFLSRSFGQTRKYKECF